MVISEAQEPPYSQHAAGKPRHCLVAVSSHGLGHLSQVTPIINTISQGTYGHYRITHESHLDVVWTVRTSLPARQVRSRLTPYVDIDPGCDDFGMVMHDALRINLAASLRNYASAHEGWDAKVDALARHLDDLQLDGVLADVPYLTLAAAQRASIPNVAICSLNWADILSDCVRSNPVSLRESNLNPAAFERLLSQMYDAYDGAEAFIQPTPSMRMPSLSNTQSVGPVCEVPQPCSRSALMSLAREHGFDEQGWFILISMGGIPTKLDPSQWPHWCLGRRIYYLVNAQLESSHPQLLSINETYLDRHCLTFASVFGACDLFVGKPGYGTFVEAACSGTPLLFLQRHDWPEAQVLVDWILRNGRAMAITIDQMSGKSFETAMATMLEQGRFTPMLPSGNEQAAMHVSNMLGL